MVIVIRLPDEVEKVILSFPFVLTLRNYFLSHIDEEEALDLHFLTNRKNIECLYLLPFNAFFHELDEDDDSSIFKVYRAYKNLKMISYVDYFFNLNLTRSDAYFGLFYRAKNRIGFDQVKGSFTYNKKIHYQEGLHLKDIYLSLLSAITDEYGQEKIRGRTLEPLYIDWVENPYIMINLDLDSSGDIHPDWKEFLEFFDEKKILLTCDSFSSESEVWEINNFLETVDKKNNYFLAISSSSFIDFARAVTFSKIFISYYSPLVFIASFCGAEGWLLNKGKNLQIEGPLGLLGKLRVFDSLPPNSKFGMRYDLGKLFDELIKYGV